MKQLWIAIGNPLRGDDGVAHLVVDAAPANVEVRHEVQLTPELAPLVAEAGIVVIVDAALIGRPSAPSAAGLTHHLDPETLIRVAREYYGFRGQAYLCSVAAESFEPGAALSGRAAAAARIAAGLLSQTAFANAAKSGISSVTPLFSKTPRTNRRGYSFCSLTDHAATGTAIRSPANGAAR